MATKHAPDNRSWEQETILVVYIGYALMTVGQ